MHKLETAVQELNRGDNQAAHYQLRRFGQLQKTFAEKFGVTASEFFSTPGRTEIGGNHTDHNHGRVLAASIDLDSIAAVQRNNENRIELFSEGYKTSFAVNLSELDSVQQEQGTTYALIRGIAARFAQLGHKIGGFNACMTSAVLPGSGISSSASVEVLVATILSALYNDNRINPEELAKISQYAENEYFGKPCGLMDQMACAVGGVISIDFRNPKNPIVEKVDFDFLEQDYSFLVVDTGGNHADLTEDYAAVPREMKAVAKKLGATVCRDVDVVTMSSAIPELREKTGDRAILRTLHFFAENRRVLQQVRALRNNRFQEFLQLVSDSGNSSYKRLQNIYTQREPRHQPVALALALSEDYILRVGEGACRVHGGGFAGTIQVFLPNRAVEEYISLMESIFGRHKVIRLNIRPYGTVYLNEMKAWT